ncbi:peptide deformylase 2 [Clostridia bacterium]|nr:peptide deformylase 2 [Clostridia bacterium]
MALRNILTAEDGILRRACRPVTAFDARLWQLLDDMRDTLNASFGIGVAAPQLGILRRVVVIDMKDGSDVIELVNPVITEAGGATCRMCESCLSLPDVWGYVDRPGLVKLKAQDRHGEWQYYTGESELAAVYLHEIDHLDGVLFTDVVTEYITDPDKLAVIKMQVQLQGRNM